MEPRFYLHKTDDDGSAIKEYIANDDFLTEKFDQYRSNHYNLRNSWESIKLTNPLFHLKSGFLVWLRSYWIKLLHPNSRAINKNISITFKMIPTVLNISTVPRNDEHSRDLEHSRE